MTPASRGGAGTRKGGASWTLAFAAAALWLGCAPGEGRLGSAGSRVLPVRLPDPAYEALFPYYAEICAVSRFERIGIERGGSAGHAVLYLKGVCREPDAPIPTLEMCREPVDDLRDPRHGTGISVNAAFRNVNWVAYPGRELFYDGHLERGQVLDQGHFEATLHAIVDRGLLRGVEVHEEKLTGVLPGLTTEQRLAESLLGTDVAIRFARSIWCATIPLERAQVERAVAYLNGLNAAGSFKYSLFFDNCTDALHNSLAAAGVWEYKDPPGGLLRGVFSMGVPANVVIALATRANLFPIESFRAVRDDAAMAESLREDGWLPTRPGALLKSAPVHRPNLLYDTSLQMYVVQGPDRELTRRAASMFGDGRYTDLESNLQYFEERYERILADAEPEGWLPRRRSDDELRERYRRYVAGELDRVRDLARRYAPR